MNKKMKPPFMTAVFLFGISFAVATWVAAETPVETSTAPAVTTPAPAVVVPPAPVAVPVQPTAAAEFIGATACLSCHEKQANFNDSIHGHSFPQAKGIDAEKSCETCHGPGSLHAASGGDRSNPGFFTIADPKKQSATELNKTCMECHQDEGRMHWVGSVHEARNVACIACHSVHNPKEDKLMLTQPSINLVCAQCHKDVSNKVGRNSHMPVKEGKMSCSSCHNPHGTANPKNVKAESVTALCYGCHTDKRGPFLWEHLPVRENCLNCHDSHGSHHEKMLVAKRPLLCQRCHDSTRHPSTFYDNAAVTQQSNRLFDKACLNCHSQVHGSNHPSGKFLLR